MYVGIVESRHDEVSAEVNDFRLAPFQLEDLGVASDSHDASVSHRDRLCPRRRSLRVDVSVDKNCVRSFGVF